MPPGRLIEDLHHANGALSADLRENRDGGPSSAAWTSRFTAAPASGYVATPIKADSPAMTFVVSPSGTFTRSSAMASGDALGDVHDVCLTDVGQQDHEFLADTAPR